MSAEIAYAAAEKAEVLLTLRRYAEARAVLGAAVAAAPEEATLWHLLARAALGAGDHPGSLAAADRAVALDPDEEWGHRLRSLALERMDRRQESIIAARQAIRLEPGLWATHARLADLLSADVEDLGSFDEALRAARRAVELAPDEPKAYEVLAQAYGQRKDWAAMTAAEEEALALAPEDADLHNNLAVARLALGQAVPAGVGFARAAALDPRGPGARNFGIACRGLFDHRIRAAVLAMWVGGFVARGLGSGDPDLKLRLWAAMAVLAIGWFLVRPLAEFVREVGPRYRRPLARAVLLHRRLTVQLGALAMALLLCSVSLVLPGAVLAWTVLAGISCYGLTAVLTWFDRKGNRIVDPGAPRR